MRNHRNIIDKSCILETTPTDRWMNKQTVVKSSNGKEECSFYWQSPQQERISKIFSIKAKTKKPKQNHTATTHTHASWFHIQESQGKEAQTTIGRKATRSPRRWRHWIAKALKWSILDPDYTGNHVSQMLSQFNEIKQSKYQLHMAFLKNVDYEWKEQEKNTKATINTREKNGTRQLSLG